MSTTDKLFNKKLTAFIKNLLRRGSIRWQERNTALSAARIERGLYKCAMCQNAFKRQEVQLDHKVEVISVETGFTTWDSYIERLFCKADGFQVLCVNCHQTKTYAEEELRVLHKKSKKKS